MHEPTAFPMLRPFRDVARNPALSRTMLAFAAFTVTEFGIWVGMMVVAFEEGGTTMAGIVGFVQLLPAALIAPFTALPADRYRRDRVLAAVYLLTTAGVGATAVALAVDAPFALVCMLAALAKVATAGVRPAQAALLPELAHTPVELAAASVTVGAMESLSLFAGPAVAGILLGLSGPVTAFTGLTVIVFASAVLTMSVRSRTAAPVHAAGASAAGIVADLRAGIRATIHEPGPRLVVGVLAIHGVLRGAIDVLIVILVFDVLALGGSGVGFLTAAYGIGAIVGSMLCVTLVGRRRIAPVLLTGGLAWSVALAVVGLAPNEGSAPMLLALAGIGRTLIDVSGRLLLLRGVPNRVLARVFGVLEGLTMLGMSAGLLLMPLLAKSLGNSAAFVAFALLLPVVLLLGWRRLTALDASARVAEAELQRLRGVPIFAPLPAEILEWLAREVIRVELPAGSTIIQQGDYGDRFYIVAEGEADVVKDGATIFTNGPGGYFGEIALLRDVPRTASVIARTDVRLDALERGVFLSAVTGDMWSVEAADEIVRARYDDRLPSDRREQAQENAAS